MVVVEGCLPGGKAEGYRAAGAGTVACWLAPRVDTTVAVAMVVALMAAVRVGAVTAAAGAVACRSESAEDTVAEEAMAEARVAVLLEGRLRFGNRASCRRRPDTETLFVGRH